MRDFIRNEIEIKRFYRLSTFYFKYYDLEFHSEIKSNIESIVVTFV